MHPPSPRLLLSTLPCAVWKYVSKHLELAKQARVCDPRQIASLPSEICAFPLIFPPQTFLEILDSGEWRLYRDNVVPGSPQFDVVQWWVRMKDRMPTIYLFVPSIRGLA